MEISKALGAGGAEPNSADQRNGAPAEDETERDAQNYGKIGHDDAAKTAQAARVWMDLLLIAGAGPNQVQADEHKAD